ncbi:hypothetical protein D3C71_2039660 [compost metagenome]
MPRHVCDALEDGDRSIDLHGRERRDEPAAAVLDIDHVVLFEQFQRLAQRRPGNLEPLRQLCFGRQPVARLQPFIFDKIGDPVPELDSEGA